MPFLDDAGIRFEEHRGPIWTAFAQIGDQVERFVALNIAWSVQLMPGVLALAFPEWPAWLRIVLGLYSLAAVAPATGALFGVAATASEGEYIGVDVVRRELRTMTLPAMRTMSPLFGAFGALVWSAFLAVTVRIPVLDVLLVFIVLLVSVLAMYWGPLVAANPHLSAPFVMRESVRLTWRHPERTLAQYAVVALALLIGTVSIGGLFLIVPVAVALLQTQLYRHVALDRDNAHTSPARPGER